MWFGEAETSLKIFVFHTTLSQDIVSLPPYSTIPCRFYYSVEGDEFCPKYRLRPRGQKTGVNSGTGLTSLTPPTDLGAIHFQWALFYPFDLGWNGKIFLDTATG